MKSEQQIREAREARGMDDPLNRLRAHNERLLAEGQEPVVELSFEVGKPLPNGAVVVAAEPNGEYVVVLAVRGQREGWEASPYVTWKVDPDTGEAFWGDYLDDFDEAVRNFRERVAN